jgi:murein L,D-transpeptidase YcbB/YkuD
MTPTFKPLASLALAMLLSFGACHAGAAVPDDIRALAASAKLAPQGAQRTYDERDWLDRFYAPRAYAPVWLGQVPKAAAAVVLLQEAATHGLAPAEYDADGLAERVRHASPTDAALDVALTRALLQYMADLRVGRVRSEYHSATPDPRLTAFDPVEQLRGAVEQNTLAAAVAKAEPRIALYKYMKNTLAHYRELAKAPAIVLPPLAKGAKVEVGGAYGHAAELRALLTMLGDEPGPAPAAKDDRYSAELAAAVKRFQERHGLLDDGVLGRDTVAAMNVPLAQRVRQLELTLERLRWLPDFSSGPIIAVNLPAFRLWAINNGDPNGEPPLEMRVIVGTAVKTQTPLFIGSMRYLEFNPYWNVPKSIEKAELIPKIARDGGYLVKNDMELVALAGGGEPIQHVNADVMAGLRAGKYRIRQRPGASNALGAVKFAMPNPDNIYLHSTSARELFKRTRRDLSHGCIRVEKPQELAEFVLVGKPEWTSETIAAAMEPGPAKTVSLKSPIPVVLFYTTAVSGKDGHVIFSPDVYKRDPMLEKMLSDRQAAAKVATK